MARHRRWRAAAVFTLLAGAGQAAHGQQLNTPKGANAEATVAEDSDINRARLQGAAQGQMAGPGSTTNIFMPVQGCPPVVIPGSKQPSPQPTMMTSLLPQSPVNGQNDNKLVINGDVVVTPCK